MSGPQWDGIVTGVWDDGDTFTAELRRAGAPDLTADFSMAQCGISVREGDLIIMSEAAVTVREPRKWTQQELDAIMARAREAARRLRRLSR